MSLFRISALALLVACGGESTEGPSGPKTLDEAAAAKCPRILLDKIEGDYLFGSGNPKTRFRVNKRGSETILWYLDPTYSNHRIELVGKKRDKDWQFDERPRGKRKGLIGEGGEEAKRIYIRPRLKECRLEVHAGSVKKDGSETMPPAGKKFGEFPPMEGLVFAYSPFDEPLFLGEAGLKKSVADAQMKELGEPKPDIKRGKIDVGMWTDASADGDASCTFTLDAFYDGQLVTGAADIPAQEPVDGQRHWKHQFEVPYTDNHTLEIHRHKTCGGKKERIAVAGLDVILL